MKNKAAVRPNRKQLRCPKCGSRIIDASTQTQAEVRTLSQKVEPIADFYAKCLICGSEIGLNKIG